MLDEQQIRTGKLKKIRENGINPYPAKFAKENAVSEIKTVVDGAKLKTAGRIMTLRLMDKLCFAHLQDFSGKAQIAVKVDEVGQEQFKLFQEIFDMGDFIGAEGEVFTTHKGEKTLLVKKFEFLGKALRPLPEKWHGLKDEEACYRQRYLDLIANEETKSRFKFRSEFMKALREFYWSQGFSEVETQTLTHAPTGASATPYQTHNNGLDIDVFLRISLELPLKELIVAGYKKVFEIGKVFRNEGTDPSHLPEHTSAEHYCAYWNFEDNMKFTEKMFDYLFKKLNLNKKIKVLGKDGQSREVDFTTPWQKVDFVKMIKKDTGIDIEKIKDRRELQKEINSKKIAIEEMETMGYGTLIDALFKKISRPNIVGPVFLYNYPVESHPLARRSDTDQTKVEQFHLMVNGWEIVKAYSELVDPKEQAIRFKEQAAAAKKGDTEAQAGDDDYVLAMEYGMPPISGFGLGIDRLLTILTGQTNLRDVVLFPLMRPVEKEIKK